MRLLLDTCSFLWWCTGSQSVPALVRDQIADPSNEVWLSAVSVWEIVLKYALRKLSLPAPPHLFVPEAQDRLGIRSLPLEETSVLHLARLPAIHRDPFDRMLICQAIEHGLCLATPDPVVRQYPVRTLW